MKTTFLTPMELQELTGGLDYPLYDSDINNTNYVLGCICEYKNKNVINNDNKVEGCRCHCI